ncbi:MAG: pgl 5 [Mucilaginibacter sp.]|nr:pgl 5 [Mucilaginibacter sp.]
MNIIEKKSFLITTAFLVLMVLFFASGNTMAQQKAISPINQILKNIKPPQFKKVTYNIVSFGAVPDGQTDTKAIFDKVINLCSVSGGGQVIVPKGVFFIGGPIVLKSHVNLHFEDGAQLLFSADAKAYLPAVLTLWEGTELYNYSPLFYAYQCSDIAITGRGLINGSASKDFATWRPQRSAEQNKLRQMGIDGTPVYQRVFGDGFHLPPDMIQFFGCKNILIDGISITDAPYWVIHPVLCNNVIVQNVTINSMNLNNDGCDPEMCTNVLIQRCNFTTGDDGIAIKAGRDQDGWRIGQPTENVIVRDCIFNSKTNGLCIGSEMSAGVRNVYMYNVKIKKCLSAIYFKSNLDRGGFIENIYVNNVQCDSARSAFIRFENNYHGSRGGHYPTMFNNFIIQNATCKHSGEVGIYAVGVQGNPLKNIILKNVIVLGTAGDEVVDNAENLKYNGVLINGHALTKPINTGVVALHTD